MFDIGFTELLVVALVGLIVLGPKRLPEVARTAGHWLGKFRRFVSDVKQDIDREMQLAELAELRNLKQELDETRRTMEETTGRLLQEANIMPSVETSSVSAPASPATADSSSSAEAKPTPVAKKRAPRRRKKAAAKQEHDRAQ